MKKTILFFLVVLCFLGCSSIQSLTSEINNLSSNDFHEMDSNKKRYIKSNRLALLNQLFSTEVSSLRKIAVVESFNLTYTPYGVIFAVKIDGKVQYYKASDGTNQKLSLFELKKYDIATETYYDMIFRLTDKNNYDKLKGLHEERGVNHPNFCNYYELSSINGKYSLKEFIHFEDFGLLNEDFTK